MLNMLCLLFSSTLPYVNVSFQTTLQSTYPVWSSLSSEFMHSIIICVHATNTLLIYNIINSILKLRKSNYDLNALRYGSFVGSMVFALRGSNKHFVIGSMGIELAVLCFLCGVNLLMSENRHAFVQSVSLFLGILLITATNFVHPTCPIFAAPVTAMLIYLLHLIAQPSVAEYVPIISRNSICYVVISSVLIITTIICVLDDLYSLSLSDSTLFFDLLDNISSGNCVVTLMFGIESLVLSALFVTDSRFNNFPSSNGEYLWIIICLLSTFTVFLLCYYFKIFGISRQSYWSTSIVVSSFVIVCLPSLFKFLVLSHKMSPLRHDAIDDCIYCGTVVMSLAVANMSSDIMSRYLSKGYSRSSDSKSNSCGVNECTNKNLVLVDNGADAFIKFPDLVRDSLVTRWTVRLLPFYMLILAMRIFLIT